MASNIVLNVGTGGSTAVTKQVTHDGDTAQLQCVGLMGVSGTEDAYTIADINGDATNGLDVDVTRLPALPAGDNNIGNVDIVTVPAPLSTTGGGTEATALRVTIANDSTGVVSIDDNGSTITVDGTVDTELTTGDLDTGAGTDTRAVVGLVGSASGGGQLIPGSSTDGLLVNLGANNDVTGTVTANLAAGTNTNEVVGDAAHDAAVAGNPVLVCGVAQDNDDTAPPNRVSAESDATRLATDRDGTLHVHTYGPQIWSYHEDSSNALTDASVHAAPGAGLSLYVTDIVCSTGAATAMNIFFEEGTTKVLGPWYLEAVAGRGLAIHFGTPKKITANTALTVTTSAAIAHSVDITGYTAA